MLSSRVEGITRKMANTLLRTGRSGVLNTARDFSCCLVTASHDLLAAAESLPIHVLSGPDLMSRALVDLHPVLRAGDAFLHNSPYHGCSHAADHSIMVPVMDDTGRHRFTVVAKAHQADCGNSQPTTYMGSARDVYEEGALILPAVRVQADYVDVDDVIRMLEMRIRVPSQWRGDFLATVGAARIGERELASLAREVGWDALDLFARDWFDYSERRMAQAIAGLKPGRLRVTAKHDPTPDVAAEGISLEATVEVSASSDRIEVDLRGNPDCLPCGLNLSEACARTAALVGVFNSVDHTVPKNAGAFRRVRVLLREGCIAGIPRHPTSCSVATTNVADRIANIVQRAIADMNDGSGLAECGAVLPPGVGVISGTDPRNGRPFVNQVFLALGGGAGAPGADAWHTMGHVGNGGMCYLDSVELDELHHPIHVHARGFVPDTEGPGRTCGAPNVFVEYGPVGCDIRVTFTSDGTVFPAEGARGGAPGAPARQERLSIDGETLPLPASGVITLLDGERIRSWSAGGGGYGPAQEREPTKVAEDVRDGWITVARARDVYLVAVGEEGDPCPGGTAVLRASDKPRVPA